LIRSATPSLLANNKMPIARNSLLISLIYPRKIGDHPPRNPMEQQSRLAIPFNRRNLSQDEDLATVLSIGNVQINGSNNQQPREFRPLELF
jgi:hypothetical protein